MSNYVKLTNNLEILKLEKIRQNIDQYIDLINNKKKVREELPTIMHCK